MTIFVDEDVNLICYLLIIRLRNSLRSKLTQVFVLASKRTAVKRQFTHTHIHIHTHTHTHTHRGRADRRAHTHTQTHTHTRRETDRERE